MLQPLSEVELYQFYAPLISSTKGGAKTATFKGYGPEDKIHMDFVQFLLAPSIKSKLKALWFHPANEVQNGKHPLYGQYLRKLGKIKGVADLVFMWGNGSRFIEIKSPTGRLTPAQEVFQRLCLNFSIPYTVIRSVDEGKEALQGWGLL